MDSQGESNRFKKNTEVEVWTSSGETRKATIINCINSQFSLVKYIDDGFAEEVSHKRMRAIKTFKEKLKEAIDLRLEYERKTKNKPSARIPKLPSRGWLISPQYMEIMSALRSSPSSNSKYSSVISSARQAPKQKVVVIGGRGGSSEEYI